MLQQYHTAVTLSIKNIQQGAEFLNASSTVVEPEPEVSTTSSGLFS